MFSLVQVDSSPNGHEELQAALHHAGGPLDDADGAGSEEGSGAGAGSEWAVTNGHLDVVRWLRLEADPPCWWNADTEARAKAKWPGVF
jgi:hypothetical protein